MVSLGISNAPIPQAQDPFAERRKKRSAGLITTMPAAPSTPPTPFKTQEADSTGEYNVEELSGAEAQRDKSKDVDETPAEDILAQKRINSPEEIARRQKENAARQQAEQDALAGVDDEIERTYLDLMLKGESPVPEMIDQIKQLIQRSKFEKQPKELSDEYGKTLDEAAIKAMSGGLADIKEAVWVWDGTKAIHGGGWAKQQMEFITRLELQRDSFIQQADLIRNEQFGRAARAASKADDLAREQGLNSRNAADLDSAEAIARAQIDANKSLADQQDKLARDTLDYTQQRDNADRALTASIEGGKLSEAVRNNKAVEALNARLADIREQENKLGFLGDMLANGGLMFFTLAQMNPEAAQSMFKQLTGNEAVGGPFAAAQGFNQQFGTPQGLRTPSAQELAQQSPLEAMQTKAVFQGQGRDVQQESARLTPATRGLRRRRAR